MTTKKLMYEVARLSSKGYSAYKISEIIGVSESTIRCIFKMLEM